MAEPNVLTRLYVGTDRELLVLAVRPDGAWERVDAGAFAWPVRALAVHPADPFVAFASPGDQEQGLYRTEDGGVSWESVPGAPERAIWWLGFDRERPSTIFAGAAPGELWRSDDGGRSWTEHAGVRAVPGRERWWFPGETHLPHVTSVARSPSDPDLWLVSVEVGGLLRSADGGRTFEPFGQGLYEDVHLVAFWPTDGRIVFAGTGQGLYQSEDGGATWRLGLGGWYATKLEALTDPPAIYALVLGVGSPVQVTTDAGASWRAIGAGLPDGTFGDYGLAVDPKDRATLFYGAGDPERSGRGALFQSRDGGASWRRLDLALGHVGRLAAA